jgi:hypothetical protein
MLLADVALTGVNENNLGRLNPEIPRQPNDIIFASKFMASCAF